MEEEAQLLKDIGNEKSNVPHQLWLLAMIVTRLDALLAKKAPVKKAKKKVK